MIDLRRLRALRELAARRTIAAAADALHLTPSAVSQQLAVLEREVGQPLLAPHGRTVRLTPAGEAVLSHAEAVFSELERMDATLAALSAGEWGRVRIGAFATGIRGLVVPALTLLRDRAPGVELIIEDAEAPPVFELLAHGAFDVALSMECESAPAPEDPRFQREALMTDVLDIALPVAHPLARRGAVALVELAEQPFVAPPRGWSCDDVIRAGCATAGFSPLVAHRSGDWSAVLALVGAGLGVACIPRLAQDSPPPGVCIRPIAGEAPARHLFALTRRGSAEHPALQVVLGALHDAAAAAVALGASAARTPQLTRRDGDATVTTPAHTGRLRSAASSVASS